MRGTANVLDLQKFCLPLCAAKARPNSAQMLKAGVALELEDVLATSAHWKMSAKCLISLFSHGQYRDA